MDSASNPPATELRQKILIAAAALAVLLGLVLGFSALQDRAAAEVQSRKNPTALAFERAAEQWLAHPREASEFERALQARELAAVGVDGALVLYTGRDGRQFSTRLIDCGANCRNEIGSRLGELSLAQGFALTTIDVDARTAGQRLTQSIDRVVTAIAPLLAFVAVGGVLFYLHLRGSLGQRTRLAEKPDTGFDDVIGAEEAKKALRRVAAFMKDPKQYAAVGAKAPRGVLLDGPPGTGKTLLARAVAGEAGVPFFSASASEFIERIVGVGASRVRELFAEARKVAPAIIFIDEIDTIGRARGGGAGMGGHDEREQTLNRILTEMDGFSGSEGVVVLAATNRADVLDPALTRPGRFDRMVVVPRPTGPDARPSCASTPATSRSPGTSTCARSPVPPPA